MKKVWLAVVSILAAAWLFSGAPPATAEEGLKAPEAEMIIEGEKKSARFSHPVHLNLAVTCGQCHHDSGRQPLAVEDIAAMESGQQLRCANCHNQDFANPDLQDQKAAFHKLCKDCHQQGVADKTGPTKCTGCHVK